MADGLSAFPLYERRALLGSTERLRLPGQYNNLTAERLTAILIELLRGEVQNWADLVQHALRSDDLLISLYTTRIMRVAQADYQVVPNEWGDQNLAKLAADFINELLSRITNWDQFVRNALHAIALGYSANEVEWDRDGATKTTFIRALHYTNPNRFRYDDQWKLRLYDHGTRIRSGMYGEPLWPSGWCVHLHNELAGDPCDAGLMRMSIWRWLFRRWADTFWIQNLEKYGSPFISAEVQANTPDAVRQRIKEAIMDLGIDRAAVIESGGKLTVTPPAMGTGQASQHELYMDFGTRSLTTTWLGASDVTQPGENGSQAAVGGRISATADPRMVTDGTNFCSSLHQSIFYWALQYNRHKFGGIMPPVPMMKMKTASDEETTDSQDLAEQNATDKQIGGAPTSQQPYEVRGDSSSPSLEDLLNPSAPQPASTQMGLPSQTPPVALDAGVPPPAADAGAKRKADTALSGPQVAALLQVVRTYAQGEVPLNTALIIIQTGFNIDLATAQQMLAEVQPMGSAPLDPALNEQIDDLATEELDRHPAADLFDEFLGQAPPHPAQELFDRYLADANKAFDARFNDQPPDTNVPDHPPQGDLGPKVLSRPKQGRQPSTTSPTIRSSPPKTLQTTSRSIGPLAAVLRNMSGGPRR